MNFLIKSAKIIDKQSKYHQQTMDVLIENGIISSIQQNITPTESLKEISFENLHISAGWIDMRVVAKDPGYESKEDLNSLSKAAMAGGFTTIATLPNTKPTTQTKETIAYLKRFADNHLIDILPIAAITKNCEGKDFTEMLDLHQAGAVAFSDGLHPLWNADILLKTLLYLHPIHGLLLNRCEEPNLAMFGQMHEGITSTMLGMKGIPPAAEELMLMRDLKLLEYAFSNIEKLDTKQSILHFSTISTKKSVELIREAKKNGLPISCDIAAHQLAFTDEDLMNFDTNLKVNPPFRSQEDLEALKKGLADGTIDAVVSDHHPQDEECKNLEFDLADFGIIGLQTAFSVLHQFGELAIEDTIEKITTQPRKLLRLDNQIISENQKANLTLFNPDLVWEFNAQNNLSKSQNSPFLGKKLKGKALAVLNKNRLSDNE
jgi:dihydroorotase